MRVRARVRFRVRIRARVRVMVRVRCCGARLTLSGRKTVARPRSDGERSSVVIRPSRPSPAVMPRFGSIRLSRQSTAWSVHGMGSTVSPSSSRWPKCWKIISGLAGR